MSVPNHMLATFRGILGPSATPLETWSFSLRFAEEAGTFPYTVPGYTQATADAFHAAALTLFSSGNMFISTDVEYQQVRLYDINTQGEAVSVPKIGDSAPAS